MILRTAHDSKAHYIVTGEEYLLSLKSHGLIKILTVTQVLDLLKTNKKTDDP
jgi:predicted nucleic acid-binding protein